MAKRRYTAEEIMTVLRQVEVAIANGKTTPRACRESEIAEQTYYRWRKEYGGLKLEQAKRLRSWRRRTRSLSGWWQSCLWKSRSCRTLRPFLVQLPFVMSLDPLP